MKTVLISIKDKFWQLIKAGTKTREIRTRFTKEWNAYLNGESETKPEPIKVVVYDPTPVRKVVGSFIVKEVRYYEIMSSFDGFIGYLISNVNDEQDCYSDENQDFHDLLSNLGLTIEELLDYTECRRGHRHYHLFIENVEVYDEPKELSDYGIEKAPQSWIFLKEQ